MFTLNYVLVSFDMSKKMLSEIKWIPLIEMSGSASDIHVHLYIVVQCGLSSICEEGTTIFVVDCVKFSVLVNKCVRPSCNLGGSTFPQKNKKNKTKSGTHHIMYYFCSMRHSFVVARYLLGTLGDSHYFL